jgi:hypothetical protein
LCPSLSCNHSLMKVCIQPRTVSVALLFVLVFYQYVKDRYHFEYKPI